MVNKICNLFTDYITNIMPRLLLFVQCVGNLCLTLFVACAVFPQICGIMWCGVWNFSTQRVILRCLYHIISVCYTASFGLFPTIRRLCFCCCRCVATRLLCVVFRCLRFSMQGCRFLFPLSLACVGLNCSLLSVRLRQEAWRVLYSFSVVANCPATRSYV